MPLTVGQEEIKRTINSYLVVGQESYRIGQFLKKIRCTIGCKTLVFRGYVSLRNNENTTDNITQNLESVPVLHKFKQIDVPDAASFLQ